PPASILPSRSSPLTAAPNATHDTASTSPILRPQPPPTSTPTAVPNEPQTTQTPALTDLHRTPTLTTPTPDPTLENPSRGPSRARNACIAFTRSPLRMTSIGEVTCRMLGSRCVLLLLMFFSSSIVVPPPPPPPPTVIHHRKKKPRPLDRMAEAVVVVGVVPSSSLPLHHTSLALAFRFTNGLDGSND
ncbi:MAG: hypothetical protein M4579_007338, partial [Chaenotheca gracillima]